MSVYHMYIAIPQSRQMRYAALQSSAALGITLIIHCIYYFAFMSHCCVSCILYLLFVHFVMPNCYLSLVRVSPTVAGCANTNFHLPWSGGNKYSDSDVPSQV